MVVNSLNRTTLNHVAVSFAALALSAFAFIFQMWAVEDFPPHPYYDEVYTVSSAQMGFDDPTKLENSHPPLAPYVIKLAILAWGDEPSTWRIPSRIFGALTIMLVVLISNSITGRVLPSILAAVLLLTDGIFITTTRAALYESQFIFFSFAALAAAIFASVRYTRPRLQIAGFNLCGVLLGLALATKWSAALFAPCIFYLLVTALPLRMACITALMIFTLAAFTYTGVCCTLTAQSVPQLFSGNLELLQTHLHPALHHRYESSGWSWPLLLRPIWFGIEPTGTTARGTICIGNPVVFLVVLVVIPLLSARGVRRLFLQGNITLTATLLPVVGFFANWLPWCMLSERRGFIYYYLPSLIFGCMAYATAISLVPAKNRWITWILLVVPTLTSVAVCVLYLPLYLGLEVPFEWMLTLLPFEAWW